MKHFLNSATGLQCCGGKCSRNADKHREEEVEKIENKEKKIDEIANEDKIKRIEEIKKSLRGLSAEELDEELEKLRAELEELKKDKEESKTANREYLGANNYEAQGHYSVLMYNDQTVTHEGDSLLILMGSTN